MIIDIKPFGENKLFEPAFFDVKLKVKVLYPINGFVMGIIKSQAPILSKGHISLSDSLGQLTFTGSLIVPSYRTDLILHVVGLNDNTISCDSVDAFMLS